MRRAVLVLAALAGATTTAATAAAATPPPGAAISDSLAVHRASPGLLPHRGGQVRHRHGQGCARDHRDLRVPHLRRQGRGAPEGARHLQPPEILGRKGYWQDEDMEIDTKRKLVIGSLDPRHDDVDQTSCPGIGQLGAKNRNPKCRSGFYASPTRTRASCSRSADFTRGPRGPHDELHRRLPLRVDRRPGAPRRPRRPRARSSPARAATAGRSGSRTCVTRRNRARSATRSTCSATTAHRLLARRRRRRPRVRLGQRPRRPARLRDQGPLARPEDQPRPRGAPVGSGAGGRRRHPGRGRRCRPAGDGLHPQRDAADGRARARGRGPQEQRGADDRGGLHGALRPGRPDRRRGHHELARR